MLPGKLSVGHGFVVPTRRTRARAGPRATSTSSGSPGVRSLIERWHAAPLSTAAPVHPNAAGYDLIGRYTFETTVEPAPEPTG